jgi:fumarate reductase flavoprotein subunit
MARVEMECDLVVLGAGGAGLVAAVKASEDSGKKVIVLEKSRKPGGATYFCGAPGVGTMPNFGGGMGKMGGAPGGGQGAPAGMQASQSAPAATPTSQLPDSSTLRSVYYKWLVAKVGPENIVKAERMEEFKDLPDPSIGPGRGGCYTIEKMLEFCKKQGVQILTETPAKKFVTDASGRVTGVLADSKNGEVLVKCKACIVASGGFGRNFERLKKYWPEPYNNNELFILCPPGMTGDGIEMAEAIGVHIDQSEWQQNDAGGFFSDGPMHHPYSWSVQSLMSDGTFASINLHGKRWKNEAGGAGSSLTSQPGSVVYSVADNEIVDAVGASLVKNKALGPMGMAVSKESNEGKAIVKWREDLEMEAALDDEGAGGSHTKKANTLVELALKMGIDPAVFVATIARYNNFCETGKDLDFGKSAESLKPIRKAPFYAIWGHRFSQCTKGLHGIAVNTNFEALNPKGEAIPGLYAVGDTATIYGGLSVQFPAKEFSGQGAGPGGSVFPATRAPGGGGTGSIVSGYLAGIQAAKYLKKG